MRKILVSMVLLLLVLSSSPVLIVDAYAPPRLQDESSDGTPARSQHPSQVEGSDQVKVASVGEVFEVNLTIIDPGGSPATFTDVYIYKGYPTRDDGYIEYEYTDTGNVTLSLGKGRYVAILCRGYTKPKFLAFYRFYVRGNETFTVQVADITFPTNLEAVKPLVNRPFTGSANFVVKVLSYPNLYDFWFSDDYRPGYGYLQVYLPKNLKYSFGYRDTGSYYALFVKNTKISRFNATIRFDASKTGFLQTVYMPPTSGMSVDYLYHLNIFGKDLPLLDYSKYDGDLLVNFNVSTSTGSYECEVEIRHSQEVGDQLYRYYYEFYINRVSVSSKKFSQIKFGGDLKETLKPSKSTFKSGEWVELEYRFDDAFKNKLIWAAADIYNKTDDEWDWVDWFMCPKYMNIYDSEGLLESNDYQWYSTYGVVELYAQTFGEPGTFTAEFVIDTGPYQGNVTASDIIKIK